MPMLTYNYKNKWKTFNNKIISYNYYKPVLNNSEKFNKPIIILLYLILFIKNSNLILNLKWDNNMS